MNWSSNQSLFRVWPIQERNTSGTHCVNMNDSHSQGGPAKGLWPACGPCSPKLYSLCSSCPSTGLLHLQNICSNLPSDSSCPKHIPKHISKYLGTAEPKYRKAWRSVCFHLMDATANRTNDLNEYWVKVINKDVHFASQAWWYTSVIPATWEEEIGGKA
jgi:hypothetical protein